MPILLWLLGNPDPHHHSARAAGPLITNRFNDRATLEWPACSERARLRNVKLTRIHGKRHIAVAAWCPAAHHFVARPVLAVIGGKQQRAVAWVEDFLLCSSALGRSNVSLGRNNHPPRLLYFMGSMINMEFQHVASKDRCAFIRGGTRTQFRCVGAGGWRGRRWRGRG